MSFFYRVFSTLEKKIWASEIENYLLEKQLGLSVCGVVEEDDVDDLHATPVELIFYDSEDREVASLVYDNLQTSEFLAEEIEEFQGYVDEMEPVCNRGWIHDRLAKTVGCYCFTVMKAGGAMTACLSFCLPMVRNTRPATGQKRSFITKKEPV